MASCEVPFPWGKFWRTATSASLLPVTKLPVTSESGLGTASKVRWGWKPPSPLPSKTETSPARKLGTTTSGTPSPLKSATPICR